jgi:RNA polymerase sigma factor (sigma-70 family)
VRGRGSPSGGSPRSLDWDDVLRRYGNLVAETVRSFQLQDADALDATQTTWLRLAEQARQVVQFPDQLGAWLVATARDECSRIHCQACLELELGTPQPDTVVDSSVGPEQRVIDAHIAQELWGIVAELPPGQRAVLQELFSEASWPQTEVAHAVGIPVGGMETARDRALRQLRSRLHDGGLGPDTWQ